MPRTRAWVVVALLLPLFASVSAEEPGREARDLRHLLVQECGSCHGLRLTGGLGSPLTPDAIATRTDEYLRTIILHGVPGTAMPPWNQRLSEKEADELVRLMREGVQ